MVNYKLCVCDKNDDDKKIIDIGAKGKLNDIDEFTANFSCEYSLKEYLLKNNIMLKSDLELEIIAIIYKCNNKELRLPVVYKKHINYIDINYIQNKILNYADDDNFLTELSNHFYVKNKKTPKNECISAIYDYLNNINKSERIYRKSDLIKKLENFIKLSVYNKNREINYRGVRDLGLFIYRFDLKQKLIQEKSDLLYEYNKINEPIRYKNYADCDGYPGDLEKRNTSGYFDDYDDDYQYVFRYMEED